jgi:hypothetical protein
MTRKASHGSKAAALEVVGSLASAWIGSPDRAGASDR